jgi:regulator of sirC expression with transglutaminase-like and TPR domain
MNLDSHLETLARDPDARLDLAELALGLARDEYADLDVEASLAELDAMAHEARSLARGSFSERVHGLCRYLFHDMGFHGNTREYYDPRNSYLNQVLERRTGIPISLSAITMAVGKRIGMDVRGIGLPGHFVVKFTEGAEQILVDPFHGGRRLSPEDCETLVYQATRLPFHATAIHLQALPLGLIVQRMLVNLKGIYFGQKDFVRALRTLERLRQLNPYDAVQHRDIGVCLMQLGQAGKAIDHLAAYLAAAPEADDQETIAQLLRQARARLAPWN